MLGFFALAASVVSLVNTIGNAVARGKANKIEDRLKELDLDEAIIQTKTSMAELGVMRDTAREYLSTYEGATDLLRESSFARAVGDVNLAGNQEGNAISDTARMQFQQMVGMYDISNTQAAMKDQDFSEESLAARNAAARKNEFHAYARVQSEQAETLIESIALLDEAEEMYAATLAKLEDMKNPAPPETPAGGGGGGGDQGRDRDPVDTPDVNRDEPSPTFSDGNEPVGDSNKPNGGLGRDPNNEPINSPPDRQKTSGSNLNEEIPYATDSLLTPEEVSWLETLAATQEEKKNKNRGKKNNGDDSDVDPSDRRRDRDRDAEVDRGMVGGGRVRDSQGAR